MYYFNFINTKIKDVKFLVFIKKILLSIITIIGTLIIIFNTHIVQEDEIVFVKSFGKIIRIIDKPGLYFKIPLINTTSTITKRVLYFEPEAIKIASKDNKNLIIETFVLWKIQDPILFSEKMQSTANAEIMIENSITSYTKMKLITENYGFIVLNNNIILKDVYEALTNAMKSYGIKILDIKIKNIYIPEDHKEAIYNKIKSDRQKIASQHINKGEEEASKIRFEADMKVKVILSKAEAEADRIKGAADAEATQIYAESYKKDPDFYKFMRTLEAYKKTLKNKPTIIIPTDSPFAKYLLGK